MKRIVFTIIFLLMTVLAYAEICSTTGPITIPACTVMPIPDPTPTPTPIPANYRILQFNAGTQSVVDSIAPKGMKFYALTVPAGIANFSMNISMISQTANVQMIIAKGAGVPTTVELESYLNDLVAIYTANPVLWGQSVYKNYPPSVWATLNTGYGGEGIYLRQGTKDSSGVVAQLPGTYFVAVKNQSGTVSPTFYIYAK